ncbi:hemophore-related protein [Mycolicibacterium fluoranthenivorans]|uniref:Hemophore-related protein n=1 Tax=Mycolicibacterium fluoranthenivorans TaxID=258505 RepID=A0A7X5ZAM4_9MYCO|nr:hemophore-related protein [Mycolicibacterium fluoranthenivorans]MCV7359115.1 hemophore-related protein [Mycolicibacterium fluoranthenivorans]NIH93701.1 hemophore-related protein [Mycolicibacterium fluoranthenivorans]
MEKRSSQNLALAVGSLAAGLALATASPATAQPLGGALIETTCSYDQLHAALAHEDPDLAALLDEYPQAQTRLRAFLALPVDQRRQRLQAQLDQNPDWQSKLNEKQGTPDGQQKTQMLQAVAATCHNY